MESISLKKDSSQDSSQDSSNGNPNLRPSLSKWFLVPIVATFIWLFFGITGIIGYRMYWNSPVHPSFALYGVVAFAAIVAFSIVLTLEFVTGRNISLKFGKLEFIGTSGPVILWILVFLAVMSAFLLSGVNDLVESNVPPAPPTHHLNRSN